MIINIAGIPVHFTLFWALVFWAIIIVIGSILIAIELTTPDEW